MSLHEFIFSNRRWHRLSRHLCFWLGWLWYSILIPINAVSRIDWSFVRFQFQKAIIYRMVPLLIFCYVITYLLVPRFLPKRKYKQFIVFFVLFAAFFHLVNYIWFFVGVNLAHLNGQRHWTTFALIWNSLYSNLN